MLSNTAFKPLPYPEKAIAAPAITDQVAYGEYLVNDQLHCYACHSADFKTNNEIDPTKSEGYLSGGNPMLNKKRELVNSANITMDKEHGIGAWTEAEFVKAVKEGRRPDGKALRYPMFPYSGLQDEEIKAIYAYLKTVPANPKEVARNFDGATASN